MNLPNKLTVIRIILVPIMVLFAYLPIGGDVLGIPITMLIMEAIFIVASITDKLDGYLARKNNQVTTFGKFLDPLADKILVLAAMVVLVEKMKIPAWIPIIVLTREFIVSGFRLVAVEAGGKVIAASVWGKLKTVTQMFALVVALIDINPFGAIFTRSLDTFSFIINLFATVMMSISVIATILSGIDYIKNGKKLLTDK